MKIENEQIERVQKIMETTPYIRYLIGLAVATTNKTGYHRIRKYIDLRNEATNVVGWFANKKELKTEQAYDDIISLISFLLPPDDVDIYPEGKGNCEAIDYTEYWAERKLVLERLI